MKPAIFISACFAILLCIGCGPVVVDDVCRTESFTFKIPDHWNYAIPDKTNSNNVARCLLGSKLLLNAKGLMRVDAGQSVDGIEETIRGMMSRMTPNGSTHPVTRKNVELDGVDATLLTSDNKRFDTPCAVIACMHNGKLFLAMLSIDETQELAHRDSMVDSLLETWSWISDEDQKQ